MTEAELQEALLRVLDRKDHAAWRRWSGPGVTPNQLLLHFQQEWLVFVRDFPRMLARVLAECPVASVRRALAANVYEEETGGLSLHRPHPELFLDMMEALDFKRTDFESVELLPEAAVYRAYIDSTLQRHWVVAAAVVTLWIEGSVHERKALAGIEESIEQKTREHFLVKHHRLKPEQLLLVKAHAVVEGGHRHDAWSMVLGHAHSEALQREVIETVETACALWHLYRDGVTRAAGL